MFAGGADLVMGIFEGALILACGVAVQESTILLFVAVVSLERVPVLVREKSQCDFLRGNDGGFNGDVSDSPMGPYRRRSLHRLDTPSLGHGQNEGQKFGLKKSWPAAWRVCV